MNWAHNLKFGSSNLSTLSNLFGGLEDIGNASNPFLMSFSNGFLTDLTAMGQPAGADRLLQ
jgi:hypothetical protein